MNDKRCAILGAGLLFPFLAAAGARAQTPIQLTGTVAAVCSIVVSANAAASTLPLTGVGPQRVQVGTVAQNCNSKAGYSLVVTSANCGTGQSGAKLVNASANENVPYTAEFNNPTTGGSVATVTGLLATNCNMGTARTVTGAKVVAETSTVFVNFTGAALLASGTYSDTLTIVMNVN